MKQKAALLFFFVFAIVLNATKIKTNPTITVLSADRQELDENQFVASGNVEITWEEYRLYADYLEFNLETKELLAKGRVTMTSQKTVISGEQFRFNLKDKTGEMVETYGQLSPTTRYTTDQLAVKDKETLTFKKLDFTPCAQCVPRWKITCSNGKIKKEKYIEMKHIFFKVKNIPVFYLPYLRYPLPRDGRATGFLFPVMGSSSRQGFFIKNAFFWDIKPNVDLTLGLDYYSKAGLGSANELRYLFRNTEGNIQFYFFKYHQQYILQEDEPTGNAGDVADQWRPRGSSDYFVKMKHIQKVGVLKTRVTIDIDKQSDPNFSRFFSDSFDSVQTLTHRSSAAVNASLSKLKIAMSAWESETFRPVDNKSTINRYLPSVEMNVNQQRLWKLPGYFSLSTTYTTTSKLEKSYGETETNDSASKKPDPLEGVPLTRLVFKPSYTLPLLKAPWANASLTFKSHHGYYPRSRDPEVNEIVILDEPLSMQYQTADFTLKGPVFSRIFEFKTSKIKHVIEPQITFKYATDVEDEARNRLIRKDNFYFPDTSQVGLALTTRLLYKSKKGSTSAREIVSYTIKQDYYFDATLANRNKTVNGIYPEFSHLGNTLRLRPIKDFSLDATVNYNHYMKAFTYILLSLDYRNTDSILSGSFKYARSLNQYKYIIEPPSEEVDPENNAEEESPVDSTLTSETIGGSLNINKNGFPLKLSSRVDYNIKTGNFTYGSLVLSYDYQCITFHAKVNMFNFSGRAETRFRFGISFGNLGMVRDMLGVHD